MPTEDPERILIAQPPPVSRRMMQTFHDLFFSFSAASLTLIKSGRLAVNSRASIYTPSLLAC